MVLTTGRLYTHWHSLTRTGRSPKLMAREPGPFVEVHPEDAAELGLQAGQLAEVTSRRGLLRLPVRLSAGLKRGTVFLPFHWGDEFGTQTAANYLTISATGRIAKQPELKYCAVRLSPACHPRRGSSRAPSAELAPPDSAGCQLPRDPLPEAGASALACGTS
jgi:ferredoxin-nitrate reductase